VIESMSSYSLSSSRHQLFSFFVCLLVCSPVSMLLSKNIPVGMEFGWIWHDSSCCDWLGSAVEPCGWGEWIYW